MACYNRQPPPSRKDAPMTTPGPDLYTRLLASSQDAFAAEFYEVAYHALMAALHYADSTQDAARLQEVATVAQTHQARLATESPEHLIAPRAAQRRGNRDVYASL